MTLDSGVHVVAGDPCGDARQHQELTDSDCRFPIRHGSFFRQNQEGRQTFRDDECNTCARAAGHHRTEHHRRGRPVKPAQPVVRECQVQCHRNQQLDPGGVLIPIYDSQTYADIRWERSKKCGRPSSTVGGWRSPPATFRTWIRVRRNRSGRISEASAKTSRKVNQSRTAYQYCGGDSAGSRRNL